jgi:hypothetical protein
MPFVVVVVGRESKVHSPDCYFCLTDISEIISKSRHNSVVICPNLPLATSYVLHSEGLRVPKPLNNMTVDGYNSYNYVHSNQVGEGTDSDTIFKKKSSEPHFITRADLNVLVRDLNLSKSQDEILALRLKG